MPVVIAFRVAGARQPTRASTLAKPSARMGWDLGKPRRHPENVLDLSRVSQHMHVFSLRSNGLFNPRGT
jgi:hypothetical protein